MKVLYRLRKFNYQTFVIKQLMAALKQLPGS